VDVGEFEEEVDSGFMCTDLDGVAMQVQQTQL